VAANSNFNTEKEALYQWLVPFPGFFHVEKQALYPVGKEILDGLGLQELAAHCGLSSAQVENVIQHSLARNNRKMLFNVACALSLRISDVVLG
jgi:protein-disulfide isomerase-like protein with CxxC motif